MKVLVTGSAGFVGSALTLRLLERDGEVVGIDNNNKCYDPALKEARLARYADHPNYTHLRMDLPERKKMAEVFSTYKPDRVVTLAAQAGFVIHWKTHLVRCRNPPSMRVVRVQRLCQLNSNGS